MQSIMLQSIFGTPVELRVVNVKTYVPKPNEWFIRVDRSSALGNPFYMKNESMRDEVCEKYKAYFHKKVDERDPLIMNALQEIIVALKSGTPVALACWCAPKRCHGETILEYVKLQMKELVNKE